MRICTSNFHQSVLLPVVQTISDIKSRVERVAQFVFSNIVILGQYLPALSRNAWALIYGISVGASGAYLIFSDKTPLKFGLLISLSIFRIVLLFSASKVDAAEQANRNVDLLKEIYEEFNQLRDAQNEENKDIEIAVSQQSQDEISQWKEKLVLLKKIEEYALSQAQKNGIKGYEIKEIDVLGEDIESQEEKIAPSENSQKLQAESTDLRDRFYKLIDDRKHYPALPEAVSETIRNMPTWIKFQKFELISEEASKSIPEIKGTIKLCQEHHLKLREGWKAYIHDKQVYISKIGEIDF